MSNEETLSLVKRSMGEILPDFDTSKVTLAASFTDLGVGSLQFVEIVSRCQRTMRVKIPRSELAKIREVGALVDALGRAPAK